MSLQGVDEDEDSDGAGYAPHFPTKKKKRAATRMKAFKIANQRQNTGTKRAAAKESFAFEEIETSDSSQSPLSQYLRSNGPVDTEPSSTKSEEEYAASDNDSDERGEESEEVFDGEEEIKLNDLREAFERCRVGNDGFADCGRLSREIRYFCGAPLLANAVMEHPTDPISWPSLLLLAKQRHHSPSLHTSLQEVGSTQPRTQRLTAATFLRGGFTGSDSDELHKQPQRSRVSEELTPSTCTSDVVPWDESFDSVGEPRINSPERIPLDTANGQNVRDSWAAGCRHAVETVIGNSVPATTESYSAERWRVSASYDADDRRLNWQQNNYSNRAENTEGPSVASAAGSRSSASRVTWNDAFRPNQNANSSPGESSLGSNSQPEHLTPTNEVTSFPWGDSSPTRQPMIDIQRPPQDVFGRLSSGETFDLDSDVESSVAESECEHEREDACSSAEKSVLETSRSEESIPKIPNISVGSFPNVPPSPRNLAVVKLPAPVVLSSAKVEKDSEEASQGDGLQLDGAIDGSGVEKRSELPAIPRAQSPTILKQTFRPPIHKNHASLSKHSSRYQLQSNEENELPNTLEKKAFEETNRVDASAVSQHQDCKAVNVRAPASRYPVIQVTPPPMSQLAAASGVILEGWLEKKSSVTGLWLKRYFILTESATDFCLLNSYYRAIPSAWGMVALQRNASIPIASIETIKTVSSKAAHGKEFRLEVNQEELTSFSHAASRPSWRGSETSDFSAGGRSKSIHLRAPDAETRLLWVTVLERALEAAFDDADTPDQ